MQLQLFLMLFIWLQLVFVKYATTTALSAVQSQITANTTAISNLQSQLIAVGIGAIVSGAFNFIDTIVS